MKVLHIWNTAGVGSIIAKYMDRLFGTESLVVYRRAFDRYGVTTYGELWDCGAKMFTLKCLLKVRKFDIVHIHSFDKIVPLVKLFYPKKPIVLHYHGSDIRGKWSLRRKYWSKANALIYSTLDLADNETPKHAIYMPNPVDTEVFYPSAVKSTPKTAFHVSYNADDVALKYAQQYNLKLTIYDRTKNGGIPHSKFPKILCQYEYYIDVKRDAAGILLKVPLSKTALEALACNLKVITWNGRIIEGLPSQNLPENVARQIFAIYSKISN